MKSIFSLLLIAATLGLQAQTFEGLVTMTHSAYPGQAYTWSVKHSRSLLEQSGPGAREGMKVYTDSDLGETVLLIEEYGERYLTRSAFPSRMTTAPTFTNLSYTGASKTIRGYECLEVKGLRQGQAMTAWIAPSLKALNPDDFVSQHSRYLPSDFALPGFEGLVLEMQTTHPFTGRAYSISTEVVEQAVDGELLEFPE